MADFIDRAPMLEFLDLQHYDKDMNVTQYNPDWIYSWLESQPAVDAVELPCKIGNRVWAIRSYKGIKHPQEGIVSEMFFTDDMRLMIAVKNVARGVWGETVFCSYSEACKAIEERKET